jgi:hypothetical protein
LSPISEEAIRDLAPGDLTQRECEKIIGGLLGGLMHMTDIRLLRAAVRWWADSEEAWELLAEQRRLWRMHVGGKS